MKKNNLSQMTFMQKSDACVSKEFKFRKKYFRKKYETSFIRDKY